MRFITPSDAPAQFYVMYGEDATNNGAPFYDMIYKQDQNNFFLLADAVGSDEGSAWADWVAASSDATAFVAAPTTFVPGTGGGANGGDSFAIHLVRVP